MSSELVVGYPLGVCPIHGTPYISVSAGEDSPGKNLCFACDRDKKKATESLPAVQMQAQVRATLPTAVGRTLEEVIVAAVDILKTCPMPKNMKQYKTLQSTIEKLTNLIKEQQGE